MVVMVINDDDHGVVDYDHGDNDGDEDGGG